MAKRVVLLRHTMADTAAATLCKRSRGLPRYLLCDTCPKRPSLSYRMFGSGSPHIEQSVVLRRMTSPSWVAGMETRHLRIETDLPVQPSLLEGTLPTSWIPAIPLPSKGRNQEKWETEADNSSTTTRWHLPVSPRDWQLPLSSCPYFGRSYMNWQQMFLVLLGNY